MKPVVQRRAQETPEVTDAALFEAMAAGDLGPLGVLFDRYHEDVRQLLMRIAPGSPDVDDLVQETFLTAAKIAGSYDGRAVARPFLIGIAVQHLRRRRRTVKRFHGLLEAFGVAPTPKQRDPEDATLLAEDETRLRAAIARLPEDHRIALVMVEWNGMSGVEAAKILGTPVGTVWRWLHEARVELRRLLERGTR
jgi:RNA polymerase sigma-70 factor (ECF subfamily)